MKVSLLDYGAGNVRSVRNAITKCGYEIEEITTPSQIDNAQVIIFPGVGSFGTAMKRLKELGYIDALKQYLKNHDRPYLGICLGMQTLFESSAECEEGGEGLGIIPGNVRKFDSHSMAVPHIGWNGRIVHQDSPVLKDVDSKDQVYFVHSYYAPILETNKEWILTSTTYGNQDPQHFISAVQKNCVVGTQFHPEKSGKTGLAILKSFLQAVENGTLSKTSPLEVDYHECKTQLVKRVVVALDVRSNDHGDLVVTKGDQYDVREGEKEGVMGRGNVRNLGKPVALGKFFYCLLLVD